MLKQRPDLIASAHLLFPTISHMSTSRNGLRMSPLFSSRLSLPISLALTPLSQVPSHLLRPLVGLLSRQRGQSAAVTTALVQSPGTVVAALTLAAEEMARVGELDEECLVRFGGRMRWYWAKGDDDEWVADSSVKEIERVLEGAGWGKERRVRCGEGMVHAFVLTDRESALCIRHLLKMAADLHVVPLAHADHVDSLARKCAGWIRDDCGLEGA